MKKRKDDGHKIRPFWTKRVKKKARLHLSCDSTAADEAAADIDPRRRATGGSHSIGRVGVT